MNLRSVLVFVCLLSTFSTSSLVADPIKFDFAKTSGQATVEYAQSLEVVVENVNRIDYTYDVTVESLLPQPIAPTALPTPGASPSGAPIDPADQAIFEACTKIINASLIQRLRTFGTNPLADWKTSELDGLEAKGCSHGGARDKIRSLLEVQFRAADLGELSVSGAVGSALAATGPGGKVIIKIEATPKLTRISGATVVGLTAQRVEGADLDTILNLAPNAATKAKVDQHKATRTFTISFEPPKGILFSFGPYLSQLERKEFGRIANPAHDPMDENSNELMIGLTEDSDQSFGVAAYWSVLVWQLNKAGIGFSWGIAYDVQNEIDEAVQGLVSLAIGFEESPLLVHIGAAVGRQERLADGFDLMDPIDVNQEIPTTTSTEVEVYLGISFRFGSR